MYSDSIINVKQGGGSIHQGSETKEGNKKLLKIIKIFCDQDFAKLLLN